MSNPLEIQGWSVSVEVDAETILTIGHNSLSGIDDFTEAPAQVIRNCAEHLLAFIGSPRATPIPLADAAAIAEREAFNTEARRLIAELKGHSATFDSEYIGPTPLEQEAASFIETWQARAAFATTEATDAIATTEGARSYLSFVPCTCSTDDQRKFCMKKRECARIEAQSAAPSPKPVVDALTTGAVGEKPVAYFQFDAHEQCWSHVSDAFKDDPDVVALYRHPASEPKVPTVSQMVKRAREHGMDLGDNPVAYEFYNKETGHAIVDYTRWTHAGHLADTAGYEARPLVYAGEPKALTLTDEQIDALIREFRTECTDSVAMFKFARALLADRGVEGKS
jgi:hypothetical protein